MLLHYLGKQNAENCVFSFKQWILFCQQTHTKTFILSLGHSWTTLHSHKNQPYAPNKTWEGSIACYRLLPHTRSSLSWRRSLCQKWELLFVEPKVKSQRFVKIHTGRGDAAEHCNATHRIRCERTFMAVKWLINVIDVKKTFVTFLFW